MTLARRATDKGEPTNREILEKLEEFISEHRKDHADLDRRLSVADVAAALRERSITDLQRMPTEIAQLHDFKVQVETLGSMTRWIFGGSLLAAVASIASLLMTLSHLTGGTP